MIGTEMLSHKTHDRPFLVWGLGLTVFILAACLYAMTYDYEFVYDDLHTIEKNQSLIKAKDHPSLLLNLFVQEYWKGVDEDNPESAILIQPKGQALYRPVMLLTWGVIYYFFGPDASAYHILNILLYAVVSALVFFTIRRLLGSWRIAFFTGLLFASHPIHTEVGAYITGLGELLTTLFFLLGLIYYHRATYQQESFRPWAYLLSLLIFLVGMFSKEGTVTLLGVIVVYDVIQAVQGRRPMKWPLRFGLYAGYLAVIGINLAARFHAIGALRPSIRNLIDNVASTAQTYDERLWTALKVLVKGIWLTILPLKLSPDYSYAAITLSTSPLEAEVLSAILFLVVILGVGFYSMKKMPAVSLGIFWYLATIFIVSNIPVIIGTVFGERLLFLPSVGFCLIVGYILDRIFSLGSGRLRLGPVAASILLAVLVSVYSMKTVEECPKWRTTERLWQHAAEVVPESGRVHLQLGQLYAANQIYREAEAEYLKALQISPQYVMASMGLSGLYYKQGQYDKALQWLEYIQKLLETVDDPGVKGLLAQKRAGLYVLQNDPEKALAGLLALKKTQSTPELCVQLGDIYFVQGDLENAAAQYKEAWDLDPENLESAYKLLNAYGADAKTSAQEKELLAVLEEKDTQTNKALIHRAQIYLKEFEPEKAMETFDRAIAMAPDDPLAHLMKAQALNAEGRLEEALKELDKTDKLTKPQEVGPILHLKLDIYRQLGDLEHAAAVADRMKILPLSMPAKITLGNLYYDLHRYHEASQYLSEVVMAAGQMDPIVVGNLAKALNEMGKYEDIVTFIAPVVEENRIRDREILQILGGALITVGEYEKGIEKLEDVLQTFGPNPWVKLQIISARISLKEYDKALSALTEMEAKVKMPAIVPHLLHFQAKIFLEDAARRDPAKAEALARKALSSLPKGDPEICLTLVKALKEKGEVEKARKEAETALKAFPSYGPLEEFLHSLK